MGAKTGRMTVIMRTFLVFSLLALAAAAPCWGQNGLGDLTRQKTYESRRESSANPDLGKNGDAQHVDIGGTLTLMDADGPGIITHFWNTLGSYDPWAARSLVLRIYYDGNQKPSVESPLGDFFGVGFAAPKDFSSSPVAVSSRGRARTCYWHIPFRKHIKITLANESTEQDLDSFYYYIDWQKHETLPEDTAYFHARYRQASPAQPGRYLLLDTQGQGHYAGTVYSAMQMETGWFGEGDDFFFIDGAEQPQFRGTGTEDYFCDAWGFREFATPYYGVTEYEGVLTGDRVSAYRWHIQDPIAFKKSLRVEIEHRGSIFNDKGTLANFELGGFEERADWVSSVAFWYQYPPAPWDEPLPPAAKRIPPYRLIPADKLVYRAKPDLLVLPQKPFLAYVPNTPEASIEFDFDLEKDGRYRLDAILLYSMMCGMFQPFLDGKKLGGPLNCVIEGYDPVWVPLEIHDLSAGKHTLRFEGLKEESPNRRAVGPYFYMFGIAGISILRLDDMDGFQQTMRRLLEERKAPQ